MVKVMWNEFDGVDDVGACVAVGLIGDPVISFCMRSGNGRVKMTISLTDVNLIIFTSASRSMAPLGPSSTWRSSPVSWSQWESNPNILKMKSKFPKPTKANLISSRTNVRFFPNFFFHSSFLESSNCLLKSFCWCWFDVCLAEISISNAKWRVSLRDKWLFHWHWNWFAAGVFVGAAENVRIHLATEWIGG